MISRRDKLFILPWQLKHYEEHKRKIRSAQPAIDFKTPPHYSHVVLKLKKSQQEKDRIEKVNRENIRLLQKLQSIMRTKRLENVWDKQRPNFLNREKLFQLRPKTSAGRTDNKTFCSSTKSTRAKSCSAIRCLACSGQPVRRNQIVPEERIPWEPPRKSWNVKIYTENFQNHKCCNICCRI